MPINTEFTVLYFGFSYNIKFNVNEIVCGVPNWSSLGSKVTLFLK